MSLLIALFAYLGWFLFAGVATLVAWAVWDMTHRREPFLVRVADDVDRKRLIREREDRIAQRQQEILAEMQQRAAAVAEQIRRNRYANTLSRMAWEAEMDRAMRAPFGGWRG